MKIPHYCLTCTLQGTPENQECKLARGQHEKGLPYPCRLGGPHGGKMATSLVLSRGSPMLGTTSEVAPSPLPSLGPTIGLHHPCRLASAQRSLWGKHQKMLPHPYRLGRPHGAKWPHHPCRLGGSPTLSAGTTSVAMRSEAPRDGTEMGPHTGKMATAPMLSWGSPMLCAGTTSRMATLPLPSQGPTWGQSGSITPAVWGAPNARRGDNIRNSTMAMGMQWGPPIDPSCITTLSLRSAPPPLEIQVVLNARNNSVDNGTSTNIGMLRSTLAHLKMR